jgi:hypothetical protein
LSVIRLEASVRKATPLVQTMRLVTVLQSRLDERWRYARIRAIGEATQRRTGAATGYRPILADGQIGILQSLAGWQSYSTAVRILPSQDAEPSMRRYCRRDMMSG